MMRRTGMTGCCAGSIFYQMGSSHGHPHLGKEKFDEAIRGLGYSSVNITVLDKGQEKEKKYLEAQGWTVVEVDHLWLAYVGSKTLKKYMDIKDRERILKNLEPKEKVSANDVSDVLRGMSGGSYIFDENGWKEVTNIFQKVYGIDLSGLYKFDSMHSRRFAYLSTIVNEIRSLRRAEKEKLKKDVARKAKKE